MFCEHCGAELSPDAIYCKNCGTRISYENLPSDLRISAGNPPKTYSEDKTPQISYNGKNWVAAILLSYFLGIFGVDRFYLGYTALGVIKLLTCGGCGVWAIIDFLLIAFNSMKDAIGQPLYGREGKEWIAYLLLALSFVILFFGFCGGLFGTL